MAKKSTDFLVSTADVAFIHNGMLAFTGTTSLNASLAVSMEDQEIAGGKGNKTLYKYKYGRKLAPTIEMAEWRLEYIAAQVGSAIVEALRDVYAVAECVTLTGGIGVLAKTPVGKVFIEKADGSILEVTANGNQITVGDQDDTVRATYKYNAMVKRVTIDADSTPLVGELIMTADKHNNQKGKVGEIQIEIPSFQLSGTFDISLEASGNTTTQLSGDALAVEGARCADGTVYGYITEIASVESTVGVSDIAATPAVMNLAVGEEKQLTIVGIKGGLYANVGIDAAECTITSEEAAVATVTNGVVKGVGAGNCYINIDYNGVKDIVKVVVA